MVIDHDLAFDHDQCTKAFLSCGDNTFSDLFDHLGILNVISIRKEWIAADMSQSTTNLALEQDNHNHEKI
ncbi:hypothetical protein D3C72_2241220 [compost metagenome]